MVANTRSDICAGFGWAQHFAPKRLAQAESFAEATFLTDEEPKKELE
jgi:hypothetical protein